MCGIAGIIKWTTDRPAPWAPPALDFTLLTEMSAAIAHRGPDGEGLWTDPRPNRIAGLVHRRLAIVDLPGGHQPMGNEDGHVQVVFNGEIYNHSELRAELVNLGHRFASDHSDTEVLVHGYEQWGSDLPKRLRGMFAFAVWDSRGGADTLFLARDRMGQKPLFYAVLDDGLVFGSTIPAVLAWPQVPRNVPREQIALYLQFGYVPPPGTIYGAVSQLMPGHWLRSHPNTLYGERYWEPKTFFRDPSMHYHQRPAAETQGGLRGRLAASVESQLIADVPIACFLSGGVDSSIVAALMQQVARARSADPITTISVGFAEADFDETRYAKMLADRIGSRHIRLEVNPHVNVADTLGFLMRHVLGQPYADSSIVPTYHLSRAARAIAPVALSGDGSDELFGGYDRYQAAMRLPRWAWLLRMWPDALAPSCCQGPGFRERWRRLTHAARGHSAQERYLRLVEIFSARQVETLLGTPPPEVPFLPSDTRPSALPAFASPLRAAMLHDQTFYLPGDVLWKVDSAAMACALEVRSPFLDHDLVQDACELWDADLINQGKGKWALRQAFADLLPEDILHRRKQGFGVPIGHWFRSDLRDFLTQTLTAAHSFAATYLQRPRIDALLAEHQSGARDHTHRLFALLMLELWWQQAGAKIDP